MSKNQTTLQGDSLNISIKNRNLLKEILPSVFTEIRTTDGKISESIDLERLKAELGLSSDDFDAKKERFGTSWPGKRGGLGVVQQPSFATLRPNKTDSVNFEKAENLFIQGDNLEVLKLLQKSYYGKIKCIFIDPPYNTGSDFIYPDNYTESLSTYLAFAGLVDNEGKKFSTNVMADGRFHTKWLNMMFPRLYLARNLLTDDGCICVMISDVEYANLRSLMNDIFGEENYINTINVLTKVAAGASGGGEDKRLKKNIEYLLVYSKNANEFTTLTHLYSGEPIAKVIRGMKENGESWKYTRILKNYNDRELVGETKDGSGEVIKVFRHKNYEMVSISNEIKSATKSCQNSEEEDRAINQVYSENFESIFRDTNAQSSIRTRVMDYLGDEDGLFSIDYVPRSGRNKGQLTTIYYKGPKKDQVAWLKDICEKQDGVVIKKEKLGTLWDDIDYNNVGKEGDIPFPNGKKPIQLIERCLDLVNDSDSIVLDFFGGSCSTAHAVMKKNARDNGTRKFIVVQLPEQVNEDDDSLESLIDFCKSQKIKLNIAEIGKERIRRSINQVENEFQNHKGKNGFRVFELQQSNFKQWANLPSDSDEKAIMKQLELHVDHIAEDATPEDILFEILLKAGFKPTESVSEIEVSKQKVYSVSDGALLIYLGDEITKEFISSIAELEPLQFICLDSAFSGNDQLKANAVQTFESRNQGRDNVNKIVFRTV